MRIVAALILLVALSSCVAVPAADPYTQRAAADGAIIATQAARNAQATNAAILASAAESDAAATVAVMQQAVQSTQAAIVAQQTQTALELQVAQATQQAQDIRATQIASATQSAATATQSAILLVTQQAQERRAQTKSDLLWGVSVFLLVVGAVSLIFVLRVMAPVFVAMAQNIAQQIRARSLIRETHGGMVMAYVQIGDNAGLFVPSDQVLQYARLMAQTQPYVDAEVIEDDEDEDDTAPPEYWHIRQLLEMTINHARQKKYAPNQLAGQDVARLGGGQWDRAIKALRAAGVNVVTKNGVGTFLEDERYQTPAQLREAIFAHQIEITALPSPTESMRPVYA